MEVLEGMGLTPRPEACIIISTATKHMTTYTKTLGNPRFFAPADRIKVTITKAERDAINAANAKLRPVTYDGDLFADMFSA